MRRNGLLLRQWTSLCQQLPSAYEDEVMCYFVSRIQEEIGFILSQISNADLTLLNIDMPQSTTVKERGARGVLGAEKQQCTVFGNDYRRAEAGTLCDTKTEDSSEGKLSPWHLHPSPGKVVWRSDLMVDWIKTVWG